MSEKTLVTVGLPAPLNPSNIPPIPSQAAQDKEDAARREQLKQEKLIVRKLDMSLMPILWLLGLFNFLDRTVMAQARLNTFEKDLGLRGDQFNVAVSILGIGYTVAQLPSNMLLTHARIRPSIYLPLCAVVWSCVSASTIAVTSYRSLLVVRFILGIADAPFLPGAFFLMSAWYTRRELALRISVMVASLVVSSVVMGFIAAGVFAGLDGVCGLAAWQWLYLLVSSGSCASALISFFVLPDMPTSTTGSTQWLLTPEQRHLAERRMNLDKVVNVGDTTAWEGLKLALKDKRTWIFVLMAASHHAASGFGPFFPTIIHGLHYGSKVTSLLMTSPPALVGAVTCITVAYVSDRTGERGYHLCILTAIASVGFVISAATVNNAARYFAAFLFIPGMTSGVSLTYSWAASTLNDSPEKRACAIALVNLLGHLGQIISPYFFPKRDSPRFVMAMLIMLAFSVICIGCSLTMKLGLKRQNAKLIRSLGGTGRQINLYTS